MKQILFIILLINSSVAYSKSQMATIKFKMYQHNPGFAKDWKWTINGVELSILNDSIQFPVNYPKPDTIFFSENDTAAKELVLSRFTAGHFYYFTINSCCQTFDLYDSEIPGYLKQDSIDENTHPAFRFKNGTVQFKVINYQDTSLLVGSFGDIFGSYTGGIIVKNIKLSKKISPFLTGYSDLINYIVIGKAKFVNTNTDDKWYDREYHVYLKTKPNSEAVYLKEFIKFQCRFFNNENVVVNYDCKTGIVNIMIE